jgi:single-stranded DNA-binding protein
MHTRNWIDTAGQKHYRTEVVAEAMRMIGAKTNNNGHEPHAGDDEPF